MSADPSLLFVNQHYAPDVASTGQHLTDLAEWLAAEGFDVEVWCARGGYTGGEVEAPAREMRGGVEVRRFWTPGLGRETSGGRILEYAVFLVQVLVGLLVGRRRDLTVFLTTPPMLPVLGLPLRGLRRRPYVVWSMDLHPEAEFALGILDGEALPGRILRWLADRAYQQADRVIGLGPAMKRRIEAKGVADERLEMIPVWNRRDEVRPVPPSENPLRAELGYDKDDFVVMYSGNAGLGHRFDEVLAAAERLEAEDVNFLFVGGGPRRSQIERSATRRGLTNVVYRDYFPREALDRSLSVGDVHLVTLRREMSGLAAPGKIYGIMAAGRPTLMVGPEDSDPGAVVTEHAVGAVVDPRREAEPVGRVVEKVRAFRDAPERRREIGERARRVFLEYYERDVCCREWDRCLRETVRS